MIYDMNKILLIAVTTLSGLTFGLTFGLLRVDTPFVALRIILQFASKEYGPPEPNDL